MTKNNSVSVGRTVRWMMSGLFLIATLACSSSTNTADTGGMSGTGVSQGSIDSFGSIFVNGVEWEIGNALIEVNDATGSEGDLRLGMIVLVRGDLDAGGLSGIATSVDYDNELEGPIEIDPILLVPEGTEKSFVVLGRTVIVDEFDTSFDAGVSFASIARRDVVEVSGFVDGAGNIRATRIALTGQFPADDEVEFKGFVANLARNGDGTGVFDIGAITVEYVNATDFSGTTEGDLVDGQFVEVKGELVGGGFDRVDATEIELEEEGLSGEDAESLEIEGLVSGFVSLADFEVAGVSVDASTASIDPAGAIIMDGDLVEVEGRLAAGVLIAESLEIEDENLETVKIEAAISAIDLLERNLTMLGVEVEIEGKTELEDERDGLSDFGFDDLRVGDWVKVEAISTGAGTARAKKVTRDDAEADVVLEGPVTELDRLVPALSILDQPIPLDDMTLYFDAQGQPRSEEEFFENPGFVESGDVVTVMDLDALQPDALLEADIVEVDD